ncbi:phasin family protein [Jiella endophytica]|uniref:Phasin family protein n=1 Tax=Jiella endophytica TaxID=2558362 RepID=A0A4Y8RR03_9HYPH|nr:phasin family protein [Jiella endophytica]
MNMYEDAGKFTKEAMDNALKSFAAMTKGFQQITAETADFTKRSYENQTAMMEKLFQAKTLDKTIELQSEYAKSSYETWVAQMTKMGDIYADIAKETYKPFEQTATAASGTMTKLADKSAAQMSQAAGEATATAKDAVKTAEKKTAQAAN